MDDEDKSFFILVLGVLAAILMVVSWWYTTGGTTISAGGQLGAVATLADDNDAAADHSQDANDLTEDEQEVSADSEDDTDGGDVAVDGTDGEEAAAEADDETSADASGADAGPVAASVFDALAGDTNLSVISGLIRDEGLDNVLSAGEDFTVFAPSNDAVSAAASSDVTVELLGAAPSEVLTYHVVTGTYTADDLAEFARGGRTGQLMTVQGESLDVAIDGDDLVINGTTRIVADSSQAAENGVVHTVDNVLVPPVSALNTLVNLKPILFAVGSADIDQASYPLLDQLVEVLSVSDISIDIEGHTDSQGDPILNQNLSQSRARSVVNYLVGSGIEERRLSAIGYGASQPVADNATEEGRAQNRRIEFSSN